MKNKILLTLFITWFLILIISINFINVKGDYFLDYPYPPPVESILSTNEEVYDNNALASYPPPGYVYPTEEVTIKNYSEEALSALDYLYSEMDYQNNNFEVIYDEKFELHYSENKYQLVKIINNKQGGIIYKFIIDSNTGEIIKDYHKFQQIEENSYRSQFGSIKPDLFKHLELATNEDKITVLIWMKGLEENLYSDLQYKALEWIKKKYPEANNLNSTKLITISNTEISKEIIGEYYQFIDKGIDLRIRNIITDLNEKNIDFTQIEGMPCLLVTLTKKQIVEYAERNDIRMIFLAETKEETAMDEISIIIKADEVWELDINDGAGVNIAILEEGNVDPDNYWIDLSPYNRISNSGFLQHPTFVASVAASWSSSHPGVAPLGTIVSVGTDGDINSVNSAFNWLQYANLSPQVVNYSAVIDDFSNNMQYSDYLFDYHVRNSNIFLASAAGNSGDNVRSPGKAWNVLTVGAADHNFTLNWADDSMRTSSSYINPYSIDREKPEIVAYGQEVTVFFSDLFSSPEFRSGTSVSTAQVTGLGALLIGSNNDYLSLWPEAIKAMIMASATNNIEGSSIIEYGVDSKDGAGCINAIQAYEISQTRNYSNSCDDSCWWGFEFTQETFPPQSVKTYTINVSHPTLLRVAISWWSQPDSNFITDVLSVDLDLILSESNGNMVTVSDSYENNYELIEVPVLQPGIYQLTILNQNSIEYSNSVGVAVSYSELPTVYLPILIKD